MLGVGEGVDWVGIGVGMLAGIGCVKVRDFEPMLMGLQYGGSPVKVGDEEYSLFRDHE